MTLEIMFLFFAGMLYATNDDISYNSCVYLSHRDIFLCQLFPHGYTICRSAIEQQLLLPTNMKLRNTHPYWNVVITNGVHKSTSNVPITTSIILTYQGKLFINLPLVTFAALMKNIPLLSLATVVLVFQLRGM